MIIIPKVLYTNQFCTWTGTFYYLSYSIPWWFPNAFFPWYIGAAIQFGIFIHGNDHLLAPSICFLQNTIFCRLTTTASQNNMPIQYQGSMYQKSRKEDILMWIHFSWVQVIFQIFETVNYVASTIYEITLQNLIYLFFCFFTIVDLKWLVL